MAERIVDHLEIIDIEYQHGQLPVLARADGHGLLHAVKQETPIGKVSKHIVASLVASIPDHEGQADKPPAQT
ncbi:hypothetical protein GCM10027296_18580 [Chitinimonas naiadis]